MLTACIGEFCETGSGTTPPRELADRYFNGGTIPWVKSGELRELVISQTEEHVTEAALKETTLRLVSPGAILLAMYGATVGRLGMLGVPATTNQAVCHIIPNEKADSRYLFHSLRWRVPTLIQRRVGGAQPNISQAIVRRLEIPLPPISEQQRIAAILDKADALRAKRRAALAQLDTLTQSIFLEMFGDPAAKSKRWTERPLSDYVEAFQGGKSIDAESGENAVTKNRILKVSAVTGMNFVAEESKPIPDHYEPPAEHFVRTGDLLFSRANTSELVGAVAFVDRCPLNLLLPDKIWRFVWRAPTIVEPLFVWALFQTPRIRYEIGRRATGTSGSMKNISQEKLLRIKTIVPPLALQRSFVRRLNAARKLKVTQVVAVAALDSLFASLQYRAFRGEL